MAKNIIYGEEARRAIKIGVDKLADTVSITLGPRDAMSCSEESSELPS